MNLFVNKTEPIKPLKEILAYEALWAEKNTTFKTIANLFKLNPGARPSDLIGQDKVNQIANEIRNIVLNANINLLINGTFDFPERLKDAKEPVELLYYCGYSDFLETRCISIVGTRNPSEKALKITAEITKKLVTDNFTIISGLAKGIDTAAHNAAIENKGRTIGVLGTPINKAYPQENEGLQTTIANEHLLLSQVPFYKYFNQSFKLNKVFFLERNKTMSALSEATLIIEAGNTSGSLIQAKAALDQNRKLLIWQDCVQNNKITWPEKFIKSGGKVVGSYEDILREVNAS